MRFAVLGDIEVTRDGVPVDVGPARQRCVLAALLIDLNRVVPVGDLVDRVWSTRAPRTPRETLRSYVSRLRTAVAADGVVLERRSGGYILRADPATVDLYAFRGLVARARAADDPTAVGLYRQALGMWRGVPFGPVDTPWLAEIRDGLDAERFAAELDRYDAELRLGAAGDLVTGLTALADAHPLDERVTGQLMLALHRDGRRGEALDRYERARRRLRDDLGVDPAAPLRQLHRRLLTDENGGTGGTVETGRPSPLGAYGAGHIAFEKSPAQLPPGPAAFAGRDDQLAALDGRRADGTAVIALSGPAGVGKTALALHWAHRVRDRFPDGQLYVNLRGFDADASAMTSAEALRGFLIALGVAPQSIPAGVDESAGLYRSLVADRTLLIVLDNATSAGQVRPLLPAGASCVTVVTSRHRLTGLAVADGAHPVAVDLLGPAEARALLARRLGPRVDREGAAVADIVRSCGRLPLALAVVAARAATRPHLPLREIAAELGLGLDALATGDPATDVRSVLSWSYRRLSPAAARVFRLLGGYLGPDIAAAAAASLTALPAADLAPLLTELVDAHLVMESGGRYSMHDLLRTYALELSGDDGAERLYDHYLRTAFAAAMLVDPYRDPIDLPPPVPGATPEPVATAAQALDWFTTEHQVLLAAATGAPPEYRWRLAWCLVNVLDRRGYWHDQAAVHRAALTFLADPIARAHSHRGLARAYVHLGRRAEARTHFDLAIERCREAGDDLLRAFVLRNLAELMEYEESYDAAVTFAEQAIEVFQETGHRAGLSNTMHQLGWYRALLGDHPRALVDLTRALALLEADDHRYGQAHTLDSLGYVYSHLGDSALASECFHRALRLFEDEGDRYFQAVVLDHLGDSGAGVAAWERALSILDELGHPDATRVRAKIRPVGAVVDHDECQADQREGGADPGR